MSDTATVEAEVTATTGSPVKKSVPENAEKSASPAKSSNSKESPEKSVDKTGASKGAANGSSENGSSPSKKAEMDVVQTAMQHLAAGKRHILVSDPNAAVTSLALACEQLSQFYGETAKECGEAYFYYGKALLELARLEAGVIDNVLDGVPEGGDSSAEAEEEQPPVVEGTKDLTEEEKDKIADDVDDAIEENFNDLEEAKKAKEAKENGDKNGDDSKMEEDVATNGDTTKKDESEENSADEDGEEAENEDGEEAENEDGEEAENEAGKGEKEEAAEAEKEEAAEAEKEESADKEDAEKGENESIASNEAGTSEAKDTKDKDKIEKEDEEDPSNLQLAWEMLELAKTIFNKHADTMETLSPTRLELESKLNETYQTLGELSIESENYPQAIEDLTTCLKRRQELLPADSRSIAETHYQLGVAMGFNLQFDEAVEALNEAIGVLERRIQNLKDKTESQDPLKKNDAFHTREREIEEIEGLIPEIREKIADTKDMKEETFKKLGDKRLAEESAAFGKAVDEAGDRKKSPSNSPSASNISHLIKKRKKSESDETADVKKPHLENGSSSTASTNGVSNGN